MQALRDAMSQIQARNGVVFGVSADTVASHKQFAEKENLGFSLLADPEATMIEAYGAQIPGRKMANRYTFVVGPDGKVAGIDKNVNQQFDRGQGGFTSEHALKLALSLTDWKVKLGEQSPYFSLPGYDGQTVGFAAGKKATIVVFLDVKERVSALYLGRLVALAADPAFKDVAILGIDSNRDATPEVVKTFAVAQKLPFPIALDAGGKLADRFGAKVAPTVWVLDAKGKALYSGAIDDSADPAKAAKHFMIDAVSAVVAGRSVETPETKAEGSPIRRARKR